MRPAPRTARGPRAPRRLCPGSCGRIVAVYCGRGRGGRGGVVEGAVQGGIGDENAMARRRRRRALLRGGAAGLGPGAPPVRRCATTRARPYENESHPRGVWRENRDNCSYSSSSSSNSSSSSSSSCALVVIVVSSRGPIPRTIFGSESASVRTPISSAERLTGTRDSRLWKRCGCDTRMRQLPAQHCTTQCSRWEGEPAPSPEPDRQSSPTRSQPTTLPPRSSGQKCTASSPWQLREPRVGPKPRRTRRPGQTRS